jgi:hypothetical protein
MQTPLCSTSCSMQLSLRTFPFLFSFPLPFVLTAFGGTQRCVPCGVESRAFAASEPQLFGRWWAAGGFGDRTLFAQATGHQTLLIIAPLARNRPTCRWICKCPLLNFEFPLTSSRAKCRDRCSCCACVRVQWRAPACARRKIQTVTKSGEGRSAQLFARLARWARGDRNPTIGGSRPRARAQRPVRDTAARSCWRVSPGGRVATGTSRRYIYRSRMDPDHPASCTCTRHRGRGRQLQGQQVEKIIHENGDKKNNNL